MKTKLSTFIEDSMPSLGHLTVGNIRIAAEKAGFVFKDDVVTASWGESVHFKAGTSVWWDTKLLIEQGTVRYQPKMEWRYQNGTIALNILAEAGYKPVEVSLPEPVVSLPIPDWVNVWVRDNYTDAGTEPELLFASEASVLAQSFVEALKGYIK